MKSENFQKRYENMNEFDQPIRWEFTWAASVDTVDDWM